MTINWANTHNITAIKYFITILVTVQVKVWTKSLAVKKKKKKDVWDKCDKNSKGKSKVRSTGETNEHPGSPELSVWLPLKPASLLEERMAHSRQSVKYCGINYSTLSNTNEGYILNI